MNVIAKINIFTLKELSREAGAAERAKRTELHDTNNEPLKEASREAGAAERAKRAELHDTNSEPLKEAFKTI